MPRIGEQLHCRPDPREQALQYDQYAIGVFKPREEGRKELVGHIPVEISQLTHNFLGADNENKVVGTVTGKRKREIGLVVPAKYQVTTPNKKHANIFMEKLIGKKDILGIELDENQKPVKVTIFH